MVSLFVLPQGTRQPSCGSCESLDGARKLGMNSPGLDGISVEGQRRSEKKQRVGTTCSTVSQSWAQTSICLVYLTIINYISKTDDDSTTREAKEKQRDGREITKGTQGEPGEAAFAGG
ncbi:hypothetical protein TEQG_06070 [Trichophyton equinum CBS 127.97]|uniref:Uncharacterized protein n=1 Tax=Trichophyton equinum (strain ATCC MYA-4606 / CBS 127.97) TaxID=559882 RepID=F2PYW3_TRIEC|nr:hypothetical protein TEQG_06070 [Trichophyton equinum CBS 127.97]